MTNKPYYVTAYGLAVKQGFKGSLDEWLASLNGYVHIKYARRMPTADFDLQDTPAEWLGIYVGRDPEPSTHYTDYKWQYVKGTANADLIAPAHRTDRLYKKGDVISYGERILRLKVNSAQGAFNIENWEATTLSQALEDKGLGASVAYTAQTLTDAQKAQARANINARDAGTKIVRADIEKYAVGEDQIGDLNISTKKIQRGAVTNDRLGADSVYGDAIKNGAITPEKLNDNAVTAAKLANGAATGNKIGSVPSAKLQLDDGGLGEIRLVRNVHYFDSEEEMNAAVPRPAVGRIAFVKAEG